MIYLTDHIIVFHHFSRYTDYEKRNSRFYIKKNAEYIPDNFDDEISFAILFKWDERRISLFINKELFTTWNIRNKKLKLLDL